ncbi:MAG: aspartate 1-decarboxylase [Clostridiales bacterium]|nr:aspartate 1-decarboxylase [Clostridiales bacterium]
MQITVLKSKIHRATITHADLDYIGSITIDAELLQASGICEYEKVQVVNLSNGVRLETYVIEGDRGTGIICLNGAAARCASINDLVIIMAYAVMKPEELAQSPPKVVFVDGANRAVKTARYEKHGRFEDME